VEAVGEEAGERAVGGAVEVRPPASQDSSGCEGCRRRRHGRCSEGVLHGRGRLRIWEVGIEIFNFKWCKKNFDSPKFGPTNYKYSSFRKKNPPCIAAKFSQIHK
jgi:hypothetical protein